MIKDRETREAIERLEDAVALIDRRLYGVQRDYRYGYSPPTSGPVLGIIRRIRRRSK